MPDESSTLVRFFRRLVARPIAVLMVVLALLGTGAIAALRIPIELQPEGSTRIVFGSIFSDRKSASEEWCSASCTARSAALV